MAHFAQLDENNIVTNVVVVNNSDMLDESGNESEQKGIEFLNSLFGEQKWVQTSYNSNFRKNYAAIGFFYDEVNDAFIAPQPLPSWVLNTETFKWETPVPMPEDGNAYMWDESTTSWVISTFTLGQS